MCSESLRLRLARFLVVASFVWPFINVSYFFPDATVEINFLFVFVAIGLVPEFLFEDFGSLAFVMAALTFAAMWGPTGSVLRLLIGVLPCLFLVRLYWYFHFRGKELIPRFVAYRALLAFVGFTALQYINFNLFRIIPEWLTSCLTVVVPRYMDVPYDEFGARGVQGWASEPSSGAMTCFAFCVVAMQQQPKKRWLILALFAVLVALNRSVYGMVFLVLLVLVSLGDLTSRLRAFAAFTAFAMVFWHFAVQTSRITELREHLDIYGLSQDSNHELMRFAQITYPMSSFPRAYSPVSFFEHEMQPLGLLPLLLGYGSVFGLVLYYRLMFRSFHLSNAKSKSLGLATIFVLSFLSSPDFVPVIVAFAYAMTPITGAVPAPGRPTKGWCGRLAGPQSSRKERSLKSSE